MNMTVVEEDMESVTNSDNDSINDSDIDDQSNVNAGWADSIAKILKSNKPKGKKTLVLSKAKKFTNEYKEKVKQTDFEIKTATGEVVKEDVKVEENKEDKEIIKHKKKKELRTTRVKPNILNKDRERTLAKVATKGVVQLFNSIKTQQGDINKKLEKAGSMEVKRNKVLKSVNKQAFLNLLMDKSSESVTPKVDRIKETAVEGKAKQWNVFQDDFMMGAKLKDWDKELEKEDEDEEEMECE